MQNIFSFVQNCENRRAVLRMLWKSVTYRKKVRRTLNKYMCPRMHSCRTVDRPRKYRYMAAIIRSPKEICSAVAAESALRHIRRRVPVQSTCCLHDEVLCRTRRRGDVVTARLFTLATVTIYDRSQRAKHLILDCTAQAASRCSSRWHRLRLAIAHYLYQKDYPARPLHGRFCPEYQCPIPYRIARTRV